MKKHSISIRWKNSENVAIHSYEVIYVDCGNIFNDRILHCIIIDENKLLHKQTRAYVIYLYYLCAFETNVE